MPFITPLPLRKRSRAGKRSAFRRLPVRASVRKWRNSLRSSALQVSLCKCLRCLRHGLPELRVVAEDDAGADAFHRLKTVKHRQHRFLVEGEAGQTAFPERLAEIAAVGSEHDLAAREPQPQRLMPGGVAIGWQQHRRTVAEQIMFAVDQAQLVAEIEIARVEAALDGAFRIHPGVPFAALDDQGRIRDQRIAAAMVEMEMRVDEK